MGRSNGLADQSNTTAIDQRPILVVDDVDTIAMILESFLVEEGYKVMVAHNGKEALERDEEPSPAIILLI